MHSHTWRYWAAAALSAALLELPFPLAGPLPPARSMVASFALAPLLWAIMRGSDAAARPLRRGFLIAYLCGVLWYAGNCYWIYATMKIHGDLPPVVSALMLLFFSLVLGLYFGLFGLCVALVRRRFGVAWALAAAPFLWVALDLAGARITSVPWDQLGYSQVDNGFMTPLAPWTGVYGISFVLIAANVFFASVWLGVFRVGLGRFQTRVWMSCIVLGILILNGEYQLRAPESPTTATAVLVQPNLDVLAQEANLWDTPSAWNQHIAEFAKLADEHCKTYIAGIPQTGAPNGEIVCPPNATHPDLVVWPEAPAFSFEESDPRFRQTMTDLAIAEHATFIVGGIGSDTSATDNTFNYYNSAMIFNADGTRGGRYDKIHLVPFGEYIPFKNLLTFAHKLTGKVSDFSRGRERQVFHLVDQQGRTHRYSVFICYEAVFADEIRHFARNGAEVLVNISDDGWYGDTSAPWQHLNQTRMRAIENRRWILRDTNTGVTAVIDPYGRVRQSIPRHAVDALPAQFGFRSDVTFYSAHGDVFAWLCAVLSLALVGWSTTKPLRASAN
jgi:apolipoprotein N-acyltransferase